MIALGAVAVLAVIAGAALLAYRLRHDGRRQALPVHRARVLPPRPAEPLGATQRPAIGAPKQELHLHFHGVTAEDVAAIIQRERGE